MNRMLARSIWIILWVLSWIPGCILKLFSYLTCFLTFGIFRYRSNVVKENVKNSLPELSVSEQKKLIRKFYQHFAELFFEMILLMRLRPLKNSKRMRFTNPEMIQHLLEDKQSLILMLGHYGNWEWMMLQILASGFDLIAVYKPQSSKLSNQLMRDIRQKPGIILVPMKETLRVVTKKLKENSKPFILVLIADQTPARVDIRFWDTFLHQETPCFTGGEKIATHYHLPVFYADQTKHGFGKYESHLTPLYDGVSPTKEGDITRAYNQLLEKTIQKQPHIWLWSHRRWKYKKEEVPLQS